MISRRNWLKTTSLASSGLLLPASFSANAANGQARVISTRDFGLGANQSRMENTTYRWQCFRRG